MMDHAQWRNYRGYSIVKERSRILGLARYALWHGEQRLGTFSSGIKAELYVDELNSAQDLANGQVH